MTEEEGLKQEIQGFKKLHKFQSKHAEAGFISGLDMSLIALDKTIAEVGHILEHYSFLRTQVLKALDSEEAKK